MSKHFRYILLLILFIEAIFFLWENYNHTGTFNLPTDDGYIYLNYIKNAASGHFFEYNIGEKSAGVTGFLWYVILTPVFFISRFFFYNIYKALLFSNYLVGISLLALSLYFLLKLSEFLFESQYVSLICGILFLLNSKLIWGAVSGMEVPLTAFMILLAAHTFFKEYDEGILRFSPFAFGLCGWAREELYIFPTMAMIFLSLEHFGLISKVFDSKRTLIKPKELMRFALITISTAVIPLIIYWYFTGLLFPTPYYIYVGPGYDFANLWKRYLAIADQLDSYHIFLYLFATIGIIFAIAKKAKPFQNFFWATTVFAFFTWKAFKSIYLGWVFRYITPYDPIISIGAGFGLFFLVESVYKNLTKDIKSHNHLICIKGIIILPFLFLFCYFCLNFFNFARNEYPLHIQNVNDAHVSVAEWISKNLPPETVITSDPIGATKLFSGRKTIDTVGLTTHEMIGHSPGVKTDLRYWIYLIEYMKFKKSNYLLYSRKNFINDTPFPFLRLVHSFLVPNDISTNGAPFEIYQVDWLIYNKTMENFLSQIPK